MQFPELGRIKAKHPQLASLIDKLVGYVESEAAEGQYRISPPLAASYLKLSEAETLGLLSLLEDAHVVRPIYEIVCRKTNAVLATAKNRSEIREILPIHCHLCDEDHGADDVRIELAFEPLPQRAATNAVG
jgi:hypothetical protein